MMSRSVKLAALVAVVLAAAGLARAGDVLTKEQFVAKVIDCNLTEKDLAERAVKNAQSADVRRFAEQLVKDHTKMNEDALALAREMKLGVASAVSKEHKEALVKLTAAKGADFDREFVRFMVDSHEKTVKMLEANAKSNDSPQARKLAAGALPTVREHLEEARKLSKSLNK